MKPEGSNLFSCQLFTPFSTYRKATGAPINNSPIIKDLTSHDMAAYAPTKLVTLFSQPVVAQDLGVKIVRFERGVVDVELGALKEEEAVMVDEFLATCQAEKHGDALVLIVRGVDELHIIYVRMTAIWLRTPGILTSLGYRLKLLV